jgi:hypothetical protein
VDAECRETLQGECDGSFVLNATCAQAPCPPIILSTFSCLTHGSAGEFCLPLGLGDAVCPGEDNIEPRNGGVKKVRLEMSEDMDPDTVVGDNVQVVCHMSGPRTGTITATREGDRTVVIEFDPALPDQDCCEVGIAGMASTYGAASADSWFVRTLAGDVSRDGEVKVSDKALIKPKISGDPLIDLPSPEANFWFDVSCDGVITVSDSALIKPKIGHTAPPCPGVVVAPGDDCWQTSCDGGYFEFGTGEVPEIPEDFFDPGSESFGGGFRSQGNEEVEYDTIVHRLEAMYFSNERPYEQEFNIQSTPIEMVALRLESCEPIEVGMPSGGSQQWDVEVGLSSVTPPPGMLRATKTYENGGTFTSTLFVQPKFVFSRAGTATDCWTDCEDGDCQDNDCRLLDTGEGVTGFPPLAPMVFEVDSDEEAPWVHSLPAGAPPANLCDPDTNFIPGGGKGGQGRASECCFAVCHRAGIWHLHCPCPPGDCYCCVPPFLCPCI